jgi:hypothetical protein
VKNDASSYATAAAVLVGAALIAVVVRSGFRDLAASLERASSRPLPSAPSAPTTTAAPVTANAVPSAVIDEEAVRADRDRGARLRDLMTKDLAAQRAAYGAACVPPGPPVPFRVPALELMLTLNAEGLETHREFREVRHGEPDILACVRKLKVAPLRTRAPGRETIVTVPFSID